MKNYYSVLGLNQDATEDEVKKRYRDLAKQYHPDVNKDPGSEKKFKDISEAYNKIKDGKAKNDYSSGGFDVDEFDFFTGRQGYEINRTVNPNIDAEISIEFLDACFGADKKIHYNYFDICDKCFESKEKNNSYNYVKCSKCDGSGRTTVRNGFMVIQTTCGDCMGYGKKISCDSCGGSTYVRKSSEVTIKVPEGINTGKILRVTGKGNCGVKRNSFGDLLLHIIVKPHPVFSRNGLDIFSVIDVDYYNCILGGVIGAGTIHGIASVEIPECSDGNTIVCAKKYGIKKEGDHFFKINVKMPKSISAKERKILQGINKIKK